MTERKIIKSIAAAAAVFIALMMAVMSIGTGEVCVYSKSQLFRRFTFQSKRDDAL